MLAHPLFTKSIYFGKYHGSLDSANRFTRISPPHPVLNLAALDTCSESEHVPDLAANISHVQAENKLLGDLAGCP
jgi:hypothetical protein